MSEPLKFYTYDLETLINFFSFTGKFYGTDQLHTFEISSRKNQKQELLTHLSYLENSRATMVGYNNLGFDWPIMQNLLNNPHTFTFDAAYLLCQEIINQAYGLPTHLIPLKDRIIPQLDMMKINHFDNKMKRTSLKSLQFAMRSESVEDLPVEIGVPLTPEQMDITLSYNAHDVTETEKFLTKCMHHVMIRKELLDTGVLTGDVLNYSDVKLGTEYLVKKIGRHKCYSGSKPLQTFRKYVEFKDIILPKISYRTESFNAVLEWFKQQIIYIESEQETPKLEAKLADLDFYFGVGGLHASVENKYFESNETHVIKDIDVSGMYPSIAIANNFAPEHLGIDFSNAYRQLVEDRRQYKKGTTMNLILKLAGNGAFGNGDNVYSPFYDPKFPKEITVNGQLQLLQLVESLSLIPGVNLIQANTDGITCSVPRTTIPFFNLWKQEWELKTALKLEEVEYSKIWIRDVNNYLALSTDGKIKSKGAYWYPKEESDYWGGSGSQWNKDYSKMVVQKVIEPTLIHGWNPEALILMMSDPFDFMLRYKTPAGAKVFIGDKEMPKTVRYYVSTKGETMKKISKPKSEIGSFKRKNSLTDAEFNKINSEIPNGTWDERIHTKNKSRYEEVVTGIEAGRLVKCCNKASDFNWTDLDYSYYLEEINKLYIGESRV